MPRQLYPIFRDQEELTASPSLSRDLESALEQSECLIVVCSPNTLNSKWVSLEIAHFKSKRGSQNIFCIIVEGEPYASELGMPELECIPSELRSQDNHSKHNVILSPDVRKHKDGEEIAIIKLVSAITKIPYSEINNRNDRRKRRQFIASIVISLSIVSFIFLVQLYNTLKIENERDVSQQRLADNLLAHGQAAQDKRNYFQAKQYIIESSDIYRRQGRSTLPTDLAYALINKSSPDPQLGMKEHNEPISAICITEDGKKLITGDVSGKLVVQAVPIGTLMFQISKYSSAVSDIRCNNASNYVDILFKNGEAIEINLSDKSTKQLVDKNYFDYDIQVSETEPAHSLLHYYTLTAISFFPKSTKIAATFTDYRQDPESPDGRTASSRQSILAIIDYVSGDREHYGFQATIYDMAITPNEEKIVVGTFDGGYLWDFNADEIGHQLSGYSDPTAHPLMYWFASHMVEVSDDSRIAAFASTDNIIDIWNLTTKEKISSKRTFSGDIRSLSIEHEDGLSGTQRVSFGTTKGTVIQMQSFGSGKELVTLLDEITVLKSAPNKISVAGGKSGGIVLWNGDQDACVRKTKGSLGLITTAVVDRESPYVLAYDAIDIEDEKSIHVFSRQDMKHISTFTVADTEDICGVRLGEIPDTFRYISCNGTVSSFSLRSGDKLHDLMKLELDVKSYDQSDEGQVLAFLDTSKMLRIFNDSGQLIREEYLGGGPTDPQIISVSGNGSIVATGFADKLIVTRIDGDNTVIQGVTNGSSITSSYDGAIVAVGHANGEISIWDTHTSKILRRINAHSQGNTYIEFTKDNYFLISGSRVGELSIWQVDTGRRVYGIQGIPPVVSVEVEDDLIAIGVMGDRDIYGDVDLITWDASIGRDLIQIREIFGKLSTEVDKSTKALLYKEAQRIREKISSSCELKI